MKKKENKKLSSKLISLWINSTFLCFQIVCTMGRLGATLLSFLRKMAVITALVTTAPSHVAGNLVIPRPVPTQFFFLANAVHHVKVRFQFNSPHPLLKTKGEKKGKMNICIKIAVFSDNFLVQPNMYTFAKI